MKCTESRKASVKQRVDGFMVTMALSTLLNFNPTRKGL